MVWLGASYYSHVFSKDESEREPGDTTEGMENRLTAPAP